MQFKSLIIASLAAVALGQTTTSSASTGTQTSTCAAQNILDACVSQTKGQVNSCNQTDWDCLCSAWGVVLTCYNNCPGDAGVFGVQQSRDQYCNAASAYGTKTASATSLVAAATSATATHAASTASGSHTGSATGSASTAASTHNAASSLKVGSGVIAIAFAGLGLLA